MGAEVGEAEDAAGRLLRFRRVSYGESVVLNILLIPHKRDFHPDVELSKSLEHARRQSEPSLVVPSRERDIHSDVAVCCKR